MDNVHEFFNQPGNYLSHAYGIRIRREIVKSLVGDIKGSQILDVGCGNGMLSNQFLNSNLVTFLDLSVNMIELAKANVDKESISNAKFIVGKLENQEFNNRFDIIISVGLIAHVESIGGFLNDLKDNLSPSGRIVLQFSNNSHPLTKINNALSKRYGYLLNRISYSQLLDLTTQLGLEVIKVIQYSLMIPGLGKLPDRLLYKYSKYIWKTPLLSKLGTDFIWLLRKK